MDYTGKTISVQQISVCANTMQTLDIAAHLKEKTTNSRSLTGLARTSYFFVTNCQGLAYRGSSDC